MSASIEFTIAPTWADRKDAWPIEDGGRYICRPAHPRPADADGRWYHPEAVNVGGCSSGCCDDHACPVCGCTWRARA